MTKDTTLLIGAVAHRTGLSERALRHYESEGLITPGRTSAGQRVYATQDLRAIARIRLLKKSGFSLAQIKSLMTGENDPATLVVAQLTALKGEAKRINDAIAVLEPISDRLANGEAADAEMLCAMIQAGEYDRNADDWRKVFERYYSPREQREWRDLQMKAFKDIDHQEYNDAWAALARRIKAALPLNPTTQKAQRFLSEWEKLMEPFTRVATPEKMKQASAFWRNVGEWGNDVETPITPEVVKLISDARAARDADQS